MANLNQITCAQFLGNAGIGSCFYDLVAKRWVILAPVDAVITAANAVSFATYLQGMLTNDSQTLRWHAFGPVVESEKGGDDAQFESFPDGSKKATRDPVFSPIHNIVRGGQCTGTNLLDFSNSQSAYGVFYVDKNGFFLGQRSTDASGNATIVPYSVNMIYVYPQETPEYTASARARVEITHIDPVGDQKNMIIIDMRPTRIDTLFQTYSVQNLGIENVTPSGAASGVFHVRPFGSCGNNNLADLYRTAIVTAGLFLVTNKATGAAITVSSIALNAAKDAVVLTLSTTAPPYPATSGPIEITAAAPSVWTAAGLKYYDNIIPVTVLAS